jgi:SAM-dependent methyltransferase
MELPTAAELGRWAPSSERRLPQTHADSMAALQLTVCWQSDEARHTDCLVARELDLGRDQLPPDLAGEVIDRPVGHSAWRHSARGELLSPYREDDCLGLRPEQFNRRPRPRVYIEPRIGRFFPRGVIAGVRDIQPTDRLALRIVGVEPELLADLNHPLAGREIDFGVRILDAWSAVAERREHSHGVVELATRDGPGMQARWRAQPTDFFSDRPFARWAQEPDAEFYAMTRLVDHLDRTAIAQVGKLYARLIKPGARVLDLMSSWKSHLPDELETGAVVGLGMNEEELDANPRLTDRLVHDLNLDPRLPYDDGEFDAVICTVSVEYLTRPFEVFTEVNRVLGNGGRFILTFSNRWFPPKVIRAWETAHEFERQGLVLEFFHRAGGFGNLETFSMRGLPRPQDDKYADRLADSDPIYAVWGSKAG